MDPAPGESSKEQYLKLVAQEKQQWERAKADLRKKTPLFERNFSDASSTNLSRERHERLSTLNHSIKLALSEAQSVLDRVQVLKGQYNIVRSNCNLVRANSYRLIGEYHEKIGRNNPLTAHCFRRELEQDIACTETEPPIFTDEA